MQPILATKLYIPGISENSIIRKVQVVKLEEGYLRNHQLLLVCAPAGFGKTTLVIEFLNILHRKAAWISLDEGDKDAQRFLVYFVEALKKAGVETGSDISALITDLSFSNPDTILSILINRISEFQEKVIAVFDDYHVLQSKKIDEIMKFLLDHQPPNLHIVIITREDPQLPLAKLRMKDRLTEIRYGELLFTKEETGDFLQKVCKINLSSKAIDHIAVKTEGWIAGLQLASLLLNGYREDQVNTFLSKFDGTNSYIIDYLVEEVLEQLDPELREFLCNTSVLERMNDKLCNELTGRSDSNEILLQLEKKNLFLIPLDDKKEWYRFHHLFADSLKTNLTEEEESSLYRKAAVWMKANGYSPEAVRYAFKSKELPLAVKVIEDSVEETFQNAQLESLLEWLGKLPEEIVIHNEIFCVRKGIALFITGRMKEGMEYINTLGPDFMEHTSVHNKGLLLMLQAMLANIQGKDAEPLASEALQYLEAWDPISRVSTMNSLGRARYIKGNAVGAADAFAQAYAAGKSIGYQFVTTLALMNYSSCLLVMGQEDIALELCKQYLEGMKQRYDKLPPYIGVIYLVMSKILEDKKETEEAVFYWDTGTSLCKSISFDGEGSLKIYEKEKEAVIKNPEILAQDKVADNRYMQSGTITLDYGESLSEREGEILKLLGKGLSNKEMAEVLFISINTVQWHLSHIYDKLGVKSRTQAMFKAKELGLN